MSRGAMAFVGFVVAGVLVILAVAWSDVGQAILTGGSFTRSVEVDRGTYFRLKVKLAYKGESQDFDIVVGCNVRVTTYRDNSSTYEAGLIPTLFGRRMSDGAAVVVRPPDACRGQTTANGKVPSEFIPLIVVYDDAETMGFGTAYVTEDAYASPLAVLKFAGATIDAATRAEFETFRAEQRNVVQPETYFSDSPPELNNRGLATPTVMFGDTCVGYARFRLVGEAVAAARRFWPSERPEYWSPSHEQSQQIDDRPSMPLLQTDHEDAISKRRDDLFVSVDHPGDFGIASHSGDSGILRKGAFPVSAYPDIGGWIQLPWPNNLPEEAESILKNGPRVGASIDFRDGTTRGFAYCRMEPDWYPTSDSASGDRKPRPLLDAYRKSPGHDLVDGTEVHTEKWQGPASMIVQRDEFFFRRFQFYLDSTRGDV